MITQEKGLRAAAQSSGVTVAALNSHGKGRGGGYCLPGERCRLSGVQGSRRHDKDPLKSSSALASFTPALPPARRSQGALGCALFCSQLTQREGGDWQPTWGISLISFSPSVQTQAKSGDSKYSSSTHVAWYHYVVRAQDSNRKGREQVWCWEPAFPATQFTFHGCP